MTQYVKSAKKQAKTAPVMSYGPLRMSKRAEFRREFDGDDESS